MTTTIPDFTDAEQKLVSASLFERYGKLVPFQLADKSRPEFCRVRSTNHRCIKGGAWNAPYDFRFI